MIRRRNLVTAGWPGSVALLLAITAITRGQEPPADGRSPLKSPPPTLADARDLLIEGRYEPAIEAFETLATDPDHALPARIGLARCRMRIGQYKEAIADLNKLNAADSADWHFTLAHLLRLTGDYDGVLRHARGAIKIDKNHAGARLLLGDTLEMLGRRQEAIEVYRWFDEQLVARSGLPSSAGWLTDTGLGFLRYSVLTQTNVARRTQHVLHEMLQVAYEQLDRSWWPARIAAADLLREKFNNDEEDGSVSDYRAALRIDGNLPEAHVGLGAILLDGWNFEKAEERAERALEINPNHAPALHLLARQLIRERRYRKAHEICERALAVNPNDLTALSLSAAASACEYDRAGVEGMRKRVAAINPTCAELHRTLADALGGIRQYPAAEREYRQAIEFDPTDANARTELGMMYMQWGLEDKARDALDAAWTLDPFNKRTKFTLELLESLEDFDRHETDHFVVRYDARRDPGMGEFIADYLERIYGPVTTDFDTQLEHKTVIELFPTQRAFGVRITGKPWIHTVGACTGRVIALASPRRSPDLMGPFDITRVLKHEFAHTVTLAATHNRIPHWLTEGLAVQQEDAPRSFFWSALLADAVRHDRLFTLESIDWAFIRPKHPNDRQQAYAQSEWMCEYIIERFGYDIIEAILNSLRQGETQAGIFSKLLDIGLTEFDVDFHAWASKQAASWGFDTTPPEEVTTLRALAEVGPNDASILGRLAKAEFDTLHYDQAQTAARNAVRLDHTQPLALEVLAKILMLRAVEEDRAAEKRALKDEAVPLLERLLIADPDGWTAPKLLGEIYLERDEWTRALPRLKQLQKLCPADPVSWRGLSGIYLKRGEDDLALPQLLELVRTEDSDPRVAAQIASIYRRRGRLRDAQYWYRRALNIDPLSADQHQALANTSMQLGDTHAALHEYRVLTKLEPDNPDHFEKAAVAAHKLGDVEAAQNFARLALELNPASAVRSILPSGAP